MDRQGGQQIGVWTTVREYLRLGRVHSAVMLGVAAVFGALASGVFEPALLIPLYLVGLLTHIFGFGLNELRDIDVDSASRDLEGKPLVSGAVSPAGARGFIYGSLISAYALLGLSFPDHVLLLWSMYTISAGSALIYDLFGKRLPFADVVLSVCQFTLVLIGAVAVGADPLSAPVLVIASYAYVMGVVQNIIAGLKDADHDARAGAVTTVLRLGSRVRRARSGAPAGVLVCGTATVILVAGLKVAQAAVALWPALSGTFVYSAPVTAVLVPGLAVQFALAWRVVQVQRFDRDEIKRRIGLHEMVTFLTAPVVFMPVLGLWPALFLMLFPVSWLGTFLLVQYGELMPNI